MISLTLNKGEQSNGVVTEVKSIKTIAIDFQDSMEQAKVKNEIVYHVLQSKDDSGVFNRYLEGKRINLDYIPDCFVILFVLPLKILNYYALFLF